ncbi:DUF1304 domain-containing protein [Gordonia sp. X0973]|uniref:DUF1304 domain-containing protein n=1 Tax=Gordonia sp. X0973 TaxID=2742602 RepID=UPI000F5254B4|nr:DUF1304 domain-containing protein [Gordonia sp. X0973]QKT08704.1 DUF1304 domain-containing protein [Gordonia sp. X0973]
MIIAGLVVALLAAALHVFIFYLESLAWTSKRARAVFGTTEQQAEDTRELAYNQGFYNLFLAVMVVVGALVIGLSDHRGVGLALVLAGTGAMLAAALVLGLSSPAHRGAAVKQGALPLIAVIVLVIGCAT